MTYDPLDKAKSPRLTQSKRLLQISFLLGRNQNAEPKRETWMTELPQTVSKNFGLGPRQFSRSTNAKTKQDKTWTQTPNEIAAGEGAEDAPNPEQDEEVGRIRILSFQIFT